MRQIGKVSNSNRHAQVYLNDAYDVVAQNGIIMGSVRYAFINGDGVWCIAILGHNGMPYHGTSLHETGSLFDLKEGEPTWTMPVARTPFDGSKIEVQPQLANLLVYDKENPS